MADYTEDELHIRLALKCAQNKCRHCSVCVHVCLRNGQKDPMLAQLVSRKKKQWLRREGEINREMLIIICSPTQPGMLDTY